MVQVDSTEGSHSYSTFVNQRGMALTQFIQKTSSMVLRPHLPSLVPATSFQTSAPHHIRRYLKEVFGLKPEYDEQGELGRPKDEDLAVGMWKKQLDAYAAGNEDPFSIGAIDRGNKGTKLDPIRVPSAFECRTIGCRCNPDQNTILMKWLWQGEPERCRCGFWFVLYYKEPFVDYTLPQ